MSSLSLRLRDNLHWCDSNGRAVFLDIEQDRYFCLHTAANDAFLRLARGDIGSDDPDRLRPLIGRGLLVESGESPARLSRPLVEPVTRDYPSEPAGRLALLHLATAILREWRTGRLLRSAPIRQVIAAARRPSSRRRRSSDGGRALAAIVAAANDAALLTRSHDRCLVRAFAVHAACRTKGIRAKLVFGVIAHPFAAHCWVQLGSIVLVGGFEQARLYTPILVVE